MDVPWNHLWGPEREMESDREDRNKVNRDKIHGRRLVIDTDSWVID